MSSLLTLLAPQSRFGDKLLRICMVCPQRGTAAPKGLSGGSVYVCVLDISPFRTAVPFRRQTTQFPRSLSPKRDCSMIQILITVLRGFISTRRKSRIQHNECPFQIFNPSEIHALWYCSKTATQIYYVVILQRVRVLFFTSNRSFYPSASSTTTSVRADSSILKRYKFCGRKTMPQRYYVATFFFSFFFLALDPL